MLTYGCGVPLFFIQRKQLLSVHEKLLDPIKPTLIFLWPIRARVPGLVVSFPPSLQCRSPEPSTKHSEESQWDGDLKPSRHCCLRVRAARIVGVLIFYDVGAEKCLGRLAKFPIALSFNLPRRKWQGDTRESRWL